MLTNYFIYRLGFTTISLIRLTRDMDNAFDGMDYSTTRRRQPAG